MHKHNWHGVPHVKIIKLSDNGVLDWGTGRLNLKDALEVKAGKKLFNVDHRLMFSVILPDRTLDLQVTQSRERSVAREREI